MDCISVFSLARWNWSTSWADRVVSFHVLAFFVKICKVVHLYSAAVNTALCMPSAMEKWAPSNIFLRPQFFVLTRGGAVLAFLAKIGMVSYKYGKGSTHHRNGAAGKDPH